MNCGGAIDKGAINGQRQRWRRQWALVSIPMGDGDGGGGIVVDDHNGGGKAMDRRRRQCNHDTQHRDHGGRRQR